MEVDESSNHGINISSEEEFPQSSKRNLRPRSRKVIDSSALPTSKKVSFKRPTRSSMKNKNGNESDVSMKSISPIKTNSKNSFSESDDPMCEQSEKTLKHYLKYTSTGNIICRGCEDEISE